MVWEKQLFPFLVDVFLLFHIDITRYVFCAKKTLKNTRLKEQGAGDIKFM